MQFGPAPPRHQPFDLFFLQATHVFDTKVAKVLTVIITGNTTDYLNTVQDGACVTRLANNSQQQPCNSIPDSGCVCVHGKLV